MAAKALPLKQFVQAASPETLRIAYSDDDAAWQARSGDVVLAKPDGGIGFANLAGLLSVLASVGIRASAVEWDGLPAWTVHAD